MTEGNILPILLSFALPVLFGNIVQQIYSLVDSVIVGQNLGANALASIGATDSLTYLFFCCTNGIATGFSICIAQAWGRKDEKDLKIYTGLIIKYYLIISVGLALLLSVTTPTILTLMNTPKELKADSSIYLIILFLGMPCSMGLNAVLAVLRTIGDSKISFYMLLVSSFTNIVLDIISNSAATSFPFSSIGNLMHPKPKFFFTSSKYIASPFIFIMCSRNDSFEKIPKVHLYFHNKFFT